MDFYFQGKALVYKGWTPEYLTQARGIFERALDLDCKNVETMVWKAGVDLILGGHYLTDDRATRVAAAETTLLKALSLAPSHAFAHLFLGALQIATNRAAQGMAECEQALALDRNLAEAHVQIGTGKYLMGRARELEGHVHEAFRLSPRDVWAFRWLWLIGFAKLQLNADAEAVSWFRRSIEANRNHPPTHFALAAALALHVSPDDARAKGRTCARS
jgi:tetratricopeptide (TPR) repeat protein